MNNFSSNQNKVLLQTAFVEDLELKNKQLVNALFESGTQRIYISSDLRNKLGLKALRKERIFITVKRLAIKTQAHYSLMQHL